MNREKLQTEFLSNIIEGLDIDSLIMIASEYLDAQYSELSDQEFIELVKEDASHLLDEVTQ